MSLQDRIENIVKEIGRYVGQGLTSKESRSYTNRIMTEVRKVEGP